MPRDMIRLLRIERKLSQVELARLAGLHQSTISKIEGGTRKIDAEEIKKIAEAFGVAPGVLLGGNQQKAVGE